MPAFFPERTAAGVTTPPPDFAARLRAAGLSQQEFRELVARLGGQAIDRTTPSRWVKGTRTPPPCALALLGLIACIPPRDLDRFLSSLDRPPND